MPFQLKRTHRHDFAPSIHPNRREAPMKFLCLGYFDREKMDALSKAEVDAVMRQCRPHMENLYKSGHVVLDAGLALENKCLRRVKGKLSVVDGPYAETKEMIGSAILIEARDMEHAIEVAALHPSTQVSAGEEFGWGLEIRPIHYFEGRSRFPAKTKRG